MAIKPCATCKKALFSELYGAICELTIPEETDCVLNQFKNYEPTIGITTLQDKP